MPIPPKKKKEKKKKQQLKCLVKTMESHGKKKKYRETELGTFKRESCPLNIEVCVLKSSSHFSINHHCLFFLFFPSNWAACPRHPQQSPDPLSQPPHRGAKLARAHLPIQGHDYAFPATLKALCGGEGKRGEESKGILAPRPDKKL